MSTAGHVTVAVIGGGQAGLSVSWYLGQAGIDHVVAGGADARCTPGRTPAGTTSPSSRPTGTAGCPATPTRATDPDGFMTRDEVVEWLAGWLRDLHAPGAHPHPRHAAASRRRRRFRTDAADRRGRGVADVRPRGGGHRRLSDSGRCPPSRARWIPSVTQIAFGAVPQRRPTARRAVLVVGTGQSGAQIAEDLHLAGRQVHLAVGSAPRVARFYRGPRLHDVAVRHGALRQVRPRVPRRQGGDREDQPLRHRPRRRSRHRPASLRRRRHAALRHARPTARTRPLAFEPSLSAALDKADSVYNSICADIDAHIEREGIDAPPEPRATPPVWEPDAEPTELDLAAEGVTSIVWAIGYRPDYRWIEASAFDGGGRPMQNRGVTSVRRSDVHRAALDAHLGLRSVPRHRPRRQAHRDDDHRRAPHETRRRTSPSPARRSRAIHPTSVHPRRPRPPGHPRPPSRQPHRRRRPQRRRSPGHRRPRRRHPAQPVEPLRVRRCQGAPRRRGHRPRRRGDRPAPVLRPAHRRRRVLREDRPAARPNVLATTVVQTCIRYDEDQRCRFCAIEESLRSGATTAVKRPAELAEVAEAAVRLDGVTQMVMTTGTSAGPDRGARHLARACGPSRPPCRTCRSRCSASRPPTSRVLAELRDAGADAIGIHVESLDDEVRRAGCPARRRCRWRSTARRGARPCGSSAATRSPPTCWSASARTPTSWSPAQRELIEMGVYPFVVPFRPLPGTLAVDVDGARRPTPPPSRRCHREVAAALRTGGHAGADQAAGCAACGACGVLQSVGG